MVYDGSQLVSHWILRETGLKGNALVSFIGPCEVKLDAMVDLEDVLAKKPIFSHQMVHFIEECFDENLERMILRQRLFVSLMETELRSQLPELELVRKGDDLYSEHFKLTVSIATVSLVSTLMHTAINVESHDTPVPTKGLKELNVNPFAFARSVMNRYREEMDGVVWARSKVRGVG